MRNWKYGLSDMAFDALIKAQDNKCAICRTDFGKTVPHVDHDHETDKVRGLLCIGCNTGIGKLGDNLEGLLKAVVYMATRSVG